MKDTRTATVEEELDLYINLRNLLLTSDAAVQAYVQACAEGNELPWKGWVDTLAASMANNSYCFGGSND